MVTTLGTVLGTSLGTELADFIDPATLPQFDTSKLYALDSLSTTNYYVVTTPATGGEQGIAGGGFGVVMLVSNPPAVARRASLAGFNGGSGWTIDTTTTAWRAYGGMTSGSNVFVDGPGGAPGQLDAVFVDLGTAQLTLHALRATVVKSTAFTTPFRMGTAPGSDGHTLSSTSSSGFAGGRILAEMSYAGAPTTAHKNALADAIRAAGDIPSKTVIEALMPGCTVRHRWSLRDVLAAANVPVTTGTVAPATIPDSVTAAGVDAMARTGSPTITVIDPSVDGRLTYGALGFEGTSFFQRAGAGSEGFPGAGTGFRVGVWFITYSLTGQRILFRQTDNSSVGWRIFLANAALNCAVASGGVLVESSIRTLTAADLGVPHLAELAFTGTQLRFYFDGVQVGSDVAVASYAPWAVGDLRLGAYANSTLNATNTTIFGATAANAVPTAAEELALYQSAMSTGRLGSMTGKTNHLWDLHQDISGNGGVIPATVQDRVGTKHLTTLGTLLQVAQRAERLWSYESTPILYGARNLSLTNYLGVATALCATATPFWLAFALVVNAKAGTAFQVLANRSTAAGSQGVNLYTSGTNGSLAFTIGNGTTTVLAPTITVDNADVGKNLLVFFQWTGTVLQAYAKRVKVGSDVAAPTYVPYTTNPMLIGRHTDSVSNPATDNLTLLGMMGGHATLTLAEIQAAHDAFVASEDLVAIPGQTLRLWSEKRNQNGTLQPMVDAQGSGETFAITGSPTLHSIYARAHAW